MTNETQTDRLAEVLQGDPETTQAWADRCLERMQQTPDGPKRKRLAQQHVDLSNRVHFERGYLAATQSLSTDLANAEAENARLREKLRPFARAAKWWSAFHDFQRITSLHQHGDCLEVRHLREADAALNPGKESA